jgi:hypothetical protein
LTGGPKVQIAGFCFPEIQFVQIAIRKDYITDERKKGAARPVQALCGTFTPTAAISFSKLTKFSTRLRVDEARYGEAKAHLRL